MVYEVNSTCMKVVKWCLTAVSAGISLKMRSWFFEGKNFFLEGGGTARTRKSHRLS